MSNRRGMWALLSLFKEKTFHPMTDFIYLFLQSNRIVVDRCRMLGVVDSRRSSSHRSS
jgi:hypothetical protein